MKRIILATLLAFAWAWPAWSADDEHYPHVLLDSDCTDSFDTPANAAAATFAIRPAAQTSGTGDGFCDHDSRIRTGAQTADFTTGAISLPRGDHCLIVFADADDTVADVGTWNLRLLGASIPHDGADYLVDTSQNYATEGNKVDVWCSAVHGTEVPAQGGAVQAFPVPKRFKIHFNLLTATSWTGDISWVSY